MRKGKKVLSMLIAVVMMLSMIPFSVSATSDIEVWIDFEGYNLGQGYYLEPIKVTVPEGSSAAYVTDKALKEAGIDYKNTGSVSSSFYLQALKGVDKGNVKIPQYLIDGGFDLDEYLETNDDDYLGEFDYSFMSGWMITVNHNLISTGASDHIVKDNDVIRWQFTVWGYGADLGIDSGWGSPAYYDHNDKSDIIRALTSDNKNSILPVVINPLATKDDIKNAVKVESGGQETGTKPTEPEGPSEPEIPSIVEKTEMIEVKDKTVKFLQDTVKKPINGSVGGEWAVLSLARNNAISEESKAYYVSQMIQLVQEKGNVLHSSKYTENSRAIIGLSSLGYDCTNFAGVNLIEPLLNTEKTVKQGINGAIYALIALDTKAYQADVRQDYIDYILGKELSGGGWALSGTTADPDITAMAVQALANYKSDTGVLNSIEKALNVLSDKQTVEGGYQSWGTLNSESVSQVICALSTLGIDPEKDTRFIKNGNTLFDNLKTYSINNGDSISFKHVVGDSAYNLMATEQAAYALTAYSMFKEGKGTFYDMTNTSNTEEPSVEIDKVVTLVYPDKIVNKVGTQFNIDVKVKKSPDSKAFTSNMIISDKVELIDVKVGTGVSGGVLDYTSKDKIRLAYGDMTLGSNIQYPTFNDYEVYSLKFQLKEKVSSINFKLEDLVYYKSSEEKEIFNSAECSISLEEEQSINIITKELFRGDGVDLIPDNMKGIKVEITGMSNYSGSVGFKVGSEIYYLTYLKDQLGSSKIYYMLIPTDIDDTQMSDKTRYSIYESEVEKLIQFGDVNRDGSIDSQDALEVTALWLRKIDLTDDNTILEANTTSDERVDLSDALSVVEYFVSNRQFVIASK